MSNAEANDRILREAVTRDAAIVGAQVGLVRAYLMRALELGGPGQTVHYTGQALNELEALRRTLREHFDSLGAPPSAVLNGP